ncbi:MAG: hypothetical protein H6925_02310 [Holosporaceae bacterium]|nr:MAG: hypothetical protein H6925_02310 [Holosporaceae bacterium]
MLQHKATLIFQKGDAVRHAVCGLRRKFDKFLIYYIWDGYLNAQTNNLSKLLLEGKISKTEYKRTYQAIIRQLEKMARAFKKLGDRFDERSVKKAIKDIQRHMNSMLRDSSPRGIRIFFGLFFFRILFRRF